MKTEVVGMFARNDPLGVRNLSQILISKHNIGFKRVKVGRMQALDACNSAASENVFLRERQWFAK